MRALLVVALLGIAAASFYDFKDTKATFLHDLGVIDSYIFPVSGLPSDVLRATNSSDPLLVAYSVAVIDAALYFHNHPGLLSTLTQRVVTSGYQSMVAAQADAYARLIDVVGADSQLGTLMSDYAKMMTGGVTFSPFIKDALVIELNNELSNSAFTQQYADMLRKIEMMYERRMMDVMLEATARARELQTPFLMMASAMKQVHDRAGMGDRIPPNSANGRPINTTLPHNAVESSVASNVQVTTTPTGMPF